jgi:hypothetical protein
VAAQAATGAIRYDITLDPASGRWYLDATWKTAPGPVPSLGELRKDPVVAVDVNAGHLAVAVVAADGNVLGVPFTVPLDLAGLPASTRGGQHWLAPLRQHHPQATGHHAAALVTGRRGLGHRTTAGDQAAQDRPGPPDSQDYLLLSRLRCFRAMGGRPRVLVVVVLVEARGTDVACAGAHGYI